LSQPMERLSQPMERLSQPAAAVEPASGSG